MKKITLNIMLLLFCMLSFSACTPNEIIEYSKETGKGEVSYISVCIGWLINYVIFIGIPSAISGLGGEYTSEITRTHEHYSSDGKYIGKTEVGTGEYYTGYNDPDFCNNWANTALIFLPLFVVYVRTLISKDAALQATSYDNFNIFITILLPIAALVGIYYLCKSYPEISSVRRYIAWGATYALGGFIIIRFVMFLFS